MSATASRLPVLDLFSAAAGGWSLGLHRAGFRTVGACEVIPWRRALYAQNNPGVRIYDDVRTLTADRLVRDGVELPWLVVGSPPCQDISPANTKGKGVDGERSGLFFEAIRIAGECGARWVALENSANLRTRGADRVIPALEALGYTVWPFVVRASDIGASHERPRSWIIAFNADAPCVRYAGGRPWGYGPDGDCAASIAPGDPANPNRDQIRLAELPGRPIEEAPLAGHAAAAGHFADSDETRQPHGQMEPCLRAQELPQHGCAPGRGDALPYTHQDGEHAGAEHAEMGECQSIGCDAGEPWPEWSGGFASHLRLDDGLSAWLAGARVVVGSPRGTSAARLIVEAYGDAVIPQIPEAIGRAILRVESALSAVRTVQ